jgi:hypothetical protein
MSRLFVLAGNWSEYADWCHEKGFLLSRVVPITSAQSIIGVHFPADGRIVRIGTWMYRSDIAAIEQNIQMCTFELEGQMRMDFEWGDL